MSKKIVGDSRRFWVLRDASLSGVQGQSLLYRLKLKEGVFASKKTPLINQKKERMKQYIYPLMISQPLAISFDVVVDNQLIKIAGCWVVSILGTYFYHKFKNRK